jgi:RNA polymerase sigma factor (sigma-70 family)
VTPSEFQFAFEEHRHAVYRFAWRMTNSADAAEDIAQEVFMTLLRRPEVFDPTRGRLATFLIAITRNLVLKRWRDTRHWEPLNDEQFIAAPLPVLDDDVAVVVGQAVNSLPQLQREVLVLSEYEELSLAEIAHAVESEVGTVKARLHRARENLRRMLAPLKPRTVSENKPRSSHGSAK